MKFFISHSYVALIVLVLLVLVYFLSFSLENPDYSLGGAFECGFQPFGGGGYSFSVPFFIVSLMFLLFDVEILLLCFYPLFFSGSLSFVSSYFWGVLLLILLATLYEWYSGVLSWV